MSWLSGPIIVPDGKGGTRAITEVSNGYKEAAGTFLSEHDAGRLDETDPQLKRVLEFYGASNIEALRVKLRGW